MPETLDLRKVLSGKDGRIYVTVNGTTYFLAEAASFTAALNPTNADVQPMGSALIGAVPTGYTVTITLNEYVVRDDVIIEPIINALKNGGNPVFDFQGVLDRTMIDGQESRQTFRNCVPDGTVNLMSMTPGEVVQRETSFRGNAIPEIIKAFAA